MIPKIPLLREILSSAPVEYFTIPAIRIRVAGEPSINLCHAYRDYVFMVDGQPHEFMGGQFTLEKPKRDSSGGQILSFGFAGVSVEAARMVRVALDTENPVMIDVFTFIEHQGGTHQIGEQLRPMELLDSSIIGDVATFEAKYNGILDLKYPREFYNSENAPGILYVS